MATDALIDYKDTQTRRRNKLPAMALELQEMSPSLPPPHANTHTCTQAGRQHATRRRKTRINKACSTCCTALHSQSVDVRVVNGMRR
mmetsp:Transcript_48621/g.121739  ORF Transcript_48621/g.121739 Transcript_48621/m.121739 type:complete len:87 (-) Transcript_48621:1269-1529(-)